MSRVVSGGDESGKVRLLGIRDGKIHEFRAHATGIDTIGWGSLRGLRITASREYEPNQRVHRDTRYILEHPHLGSLMLTLGI